MTNTVIIENCSDEEAPDPDSIQSWVDAAVGDRMEAAELCICIVSEAEGAELNARYRGKQGATNVLSFAADLPEIVPLPLLGDIVICAAIVLKEAQEQGKQVQAHWAHMVVHSTLHLLGYDHLDSAGAKQMESAEAEILRSLNFPPPYATGCPPPECSSVEVSSIEGLSIESSAPGFASNSTSTGAAKNIPKKTNIGDEN
jgi:probable rRNA maturation factor